MAQKLIEVHELKKYYNGGDVKALDGVTVDVYKGDVIAVIGPSGGGKSTFLRSLNMLEAPTSGSIIFDGADITAKKVNLAQHRIVLKIDHRVVLCRGFEQLTMLRMLRLVRFVVI